MIDEEYTLTENASDPFRVVFHITRPLTVALIVLVALIVVSDLVLFAGGFVPTRTTSAFTVVVSALGLLYYRRWSSHPKRIPTSAFIITGTIGLIALLRWLAVELMTANDLTYPIGGVTEVMFVLLVLIVWAAAAYSADDIPITVSIQGGAGDTKFKSSEEDEL